MEGEINVDWKSLYKMNRIYHSPATIIAQPLVGGSQLVKTMD